MTRARDLSNDEANGGGATPPYVAGKNAIINGGMDIWQRGTSFTNGGQYTADRWYFDISASTVTSTRESTIVPAGFQYSWKVNKSAGSATATLMGQTIETANAIQYAGKTVVVSFYAAADSATTFSPVLTYSTAADNPRSGSWTSITPTANGATSVSTTSFVRIISTFAVPSTAKSLFMYIEPSIASGANIYVTGFQLEIGSVATPFARAGGTLQGELAACYRYFQKFGGTQVNESFPYVGFSYSTTQGEGPLTHKGTMRTTPSVAFSTLKVSDVATYNLAVTNLTLTSSGSGPDASYLVFTVASGTSSGKINYMRTDATTAGYLYLSAEL